MSTTVISAPGKVLLAGGYLVLDRTHTGVVISTSARFYSVVQELDDGAGVLVRAPQFPNAQWRYSVDPASGTVTQTDGEKNKFVQSALDTAFRVIAELNGSVTTKPLRITIVGDNDFYSQRSQLDEKGLPRTRSSLSQLPPFNSPGTSLSDVHKTGLGSSAALTTSLVLAILIHTGVTSTPNDSLAHHAAQRAHCVAQGKLGSGFDVAAAVFGSMLYKRFDPAAVPMDEGAETLVPRLRDDKWNESVAPFTLPVGVKLLLADVDAGSDTPSLVGKVLKWRKEKADEANALWTELSNANDELAKSITALDQLSKGDRGAYDAALKYAAGVRHGEWVLHAQPDSQATVLKELCRIRELMDTIRKNMRKMGENADVPIEPPEQTNLLDACVALQGVIGGGVPGAGGYDAIWVLVIEANGDAEAEVEKLWLEWKEVDVSPLLTGAGSGEDQGARIESVNDIEGLARVLHVV